MKHWCHGHRRQLATFSATQCTKMPAILSFRSQQQPLDFFFLPFLLFFVGAAALGKAELTAEPVITKLSRAMSVMSWVACSLTLPASDMVPRKQDELCVCMF